eukprot:gb/GFBE01047184.1/.p1 GENE.gb/GFBE01047184.1/~~gb/GFBE01047184.1/.p1  ORF type:complete len:694 (+),score=178.32 gb/GFBE01047184.1/:1-2082(+)
MQPVPASYVMRAPSTLQAPVASQQLSTRVPSVRAQPVLVQQPSMGYRVVSGQPRVNFQQPPVIANGGSVVAENQAKAAAGLEVLAAALGGSTNAKINRQALVPDRRGAEITKRFSVDDDALGEGAMGKVYTAKRKTGESAGDEGTRPTADNDASAMQHFQRQYAVKKMFIWDSDMKEKYEQEAAVMKQLDHPNICKLLETYQKGRFQYFVMELCEGGDVFDRCMDSPEHHFSEEVTAEIIKQAANALIYAHHEHGIVHRDIKPENMMFVNKDPCDNYIKVIDWGLAFQLGNGKMASVVGSFSYMAPEVLQADMGGWCLSGSSGYTASCDFFSLGVVTYVLLCGRPPFWGSMDKKMDMLKQMKSESYPMSDEIWQSISPQAKDFVKQLLKADPKKRLGGEELRQHPWLKIQHQKVDPKIAASVLRNMQDFSRQNNFFAMCITSIAQQLDHSSLRDVHKVFTELDTDGDGVLRLEEIKRGFSKMFAANPQQLKDLEEMFAKLDTNGSGVIDYTEFCAAGIGERIFLEEGALWAAFEAFDVQEEDGKISKAEIIQMLKSGDMNGVWSQDVCDSVADDIMKTYDHDHNGYLTFDEWLLLLRQTHREKRGITKLRTAEDLEALEEMEHEIVGEKGALEKAFTVMQHLDRIDQSSRRITERIQDMAPTLHEKSAKPRGLRRWFPSCFSTANVRVPGQGR